MIDYLVLKIVWWMIIGVVLVVYAATAGFDTGITLMLPFFRKEIDRRVLLNISAPTWDGNLTWIVFAGGGLFVIWPAVYSLAFSGLYCLMLLVLWSFFLRPPGYDYRSKMMTLKKKHFWDYGLCISSFTSSFLFGLAVGNCFMGFPFYYDPISFRDFYMGHFWNLFHGFPILVGVASVLMILMHGAVYVFRRAEDEIAERGRQIHWWSTLLLAFVFTAAGLWLMLGINGYQLIKAPHYVTLYPMDNEVTQTIGGWILSYKDYPWKAFGPLIAYCGFFISLWANWMRWITLCFWMSVLSIGGIMATAGFTLFPFIMPSSLRPDQSLTVWNSTSTQYALNIMLYIGVILLMVILAYKIYAYHVIWSGKKTLNAKDIEERSHELY